MVTKRSQLGMDMANPNGNFTWFGSKVDTHLPTSTPQSSADSLGSISIGRYSLHIIDNIHNCELVEDYIVEAAVDCPEIATGFSPNGDGINDYWVVGALEQYVNAEVSIYNRWGGLVFYSRDNKDYWDGKHNGIDLPIGDYFFIINDPDGGNVKHGRVTLRR